MRYLFVFVFLTFSPLSWAENAATPKSCNSDRGAAVISLQGKLFYDSGSNQTANWQEARLDNILCEGSRIKVADNSRATIRLANGIYLRLAANTIIALKEVGLDQPTWLSLVQGFLHTISRTPKRLTIETPIANAGPEGTEFAMSVDNNKASLWVYEGGVRFFNAKGEIKLKPGDAAQAIAGQAPRAIIDIKPQDAVSWALYYPPVLPYPDSADSIDPGIRQVLQNYRQGHVDKALNQLDSISSSQQSPYFYKVRGAIRLTAGQDSLALQDIETILAKNPNDADALALQSIRALTQNRKDEAYTLAHKAVTANPKSASAYSALSYAEQGRFNLDKAQAAADQATKLAPNDALIWARKAELELSQSLTKESQQSAKKAAELDPKMERTQTVMGFSHLISMDSEEALHSFNQAIQLDSTSPLARLGLGLAKIRNGDLEQGRADLEIAATLDPNNSIVRSYLGKAYYEERRPAMADEQYKLAKERDPKDPTPYFYDAINKQTTNRPVEALHDMQKAIELNDNRGVYRSKFQLDKDTAARQVGLGRIFNNLGFDDPANRQAMKSLAIDPSNYSAHRLLSDSYATKPRHEIARASEHLQSQLLQPLNYNPIQPSLAYTDLNIIRGIGPNDTAFNEYNRMFERNGVRFTSTGIAGSNSTYGDETALSGIYNKFSYSLGQLHYQTNGFRENYDLKHNIYNAFAQYEISPMFNVQAEYRHRETEHGDLELKGNSDNFDPFYRRRLEEDTYRYAAKATPTKKSDFLFSFIHNNRQETTSQNKGNAEFFTSTWNYDIETQHIYNYDILNIISGGGMYRSEKDIDNTFRNSRRRCGDPDITCHEIFDYNVTQYFGYLYSNHKIFDNLNLTAGLSFDHYRNNRKIPKNREITLNELNPKLGLTWQANKYITLRAAVFKSVKSTIANNQILQPMQIAGFNQFFDDINGTVAWQYGVGIDSHFHKNVYAGIEAYKRDLKTPSSGTFIKPREELYRFYLNWIPSEYMALNTEFRFENHRYMGGDDALPNSVETAYIPLEIRFFHPTGFFASLRGTYVNQKMSNIIIFDENGNITDHSFGKSFKSDFYLVDAALGYRFPKQYGLISLEAKNLFDTHFTYRDRQYQMNEQRSPDFIPERMLFGRITLNF